MESNNVNYVAANKGTSLSYDTQKMRVEIHDVNNDGKWDIYRTSGSGKSNNATSVARDSLKVVKGRLDEYGISRYELTDRAKLKKVSRVWRDHRKHASGFFNGFKKVMKCTLKQQKDSSFGSYIYSTLRCENGRSDSKYSYVKWDRFDSSSGSTWSTGFTMFLADDGAYGVAFVDKDGNKYHFERSKYIDPVQDQLATLYAGLNYSWGRGLNPSFPYDDSAYEQDGEDFQYTPEYAPEFNW